MWVQSLHQEDPMEEEVATHSSIPAWENPMDCSLPGSSVHLYLKGDGSKYCVECSITISFGVVETASSPITTSFNRMNYMLLYKFVLSDQIRSDQLLSRVRLFATP